ncbi:GNAT family N-acetyltransferase [Paenibacillus silvae]|uniref:GNAT family N-acetyltransferase n=1 Tax=Paenibacillus silvae TaxID=1325358 RepID=UPI0011A0D4C5|nr:MULTISPECIES: GNAT family N-acetyltransferase [Paenibacillus]MCK6077154.1 GNAT family N-acetyltransferase [Paenibacillus silvae]MCK6151351.1 GNAT family N-acetyltransferase [Paenibacillus silvae]MCK6269840.1 GNAT family N-acetyltransferase [Paenibacillus silvae]
MDIDKLFAESPEFETQRLYLRRLTMDDLDQYYAFASDPKVSEQSLWHCHQTKEDSIGYLERVLRNYEQKTVYIWAFVLKETDTLIGRGGIFDLDESMQSCELGYAIGSTYWGKGLAVEAMQPVMNYCFEQLDCNRVQGKCNAGNIGSARVMEKLGMAQEGLLRKQLKIKGVFTDQKLYARIRDDL